MTDERLYQMGEHYDDLQLLMTGHLEGPMLVMHALLRIARRAAETVDQWPEAQWPTAWHEGPIPSKAQTLALLQRAKDQGSPRLASGIDRHKEARRFLDILGPLSEALRPFRY